jgi:hypothetical protein
MADSVPLSDVLIVLKARKVSLSAVDISINRYIVAKDGIIEEITFTDPVGKHRLHYLCHKFNIPVYLFWHTEMLDLKPGDWPS